MFKDTYTPEELEQHRKEWIDALLSGKYKQGRHNLRTADDNYCCLGVACEVAGIPAVKNDEIDSSRYSFEKKTCALPMSAMKYFGIEDKFGMFRNSNDELLSLSTMNDAGVSFTKIAEIIKDNWENIFTNSSVSDYKEEENA